MACFVGIQSVDIVFATMPQPVPGRCPHLSMYGNSFYCNFQPPENSLKMPYQLQNSKTPIGKAVAFQYCMWNDSGYCGIKEKH